TLSQLKDKLDILGVICNIAKLQESLADLAARGLLSYNENNWQQTEPTLAAALDQKVSHQALAEKLAEQTLQEHPLYNEAKRFLSQSGFTIQPIDRFGLLCTSDLPIWA